MWMVRSASSAVSPLAGSVKTHRAGSSTRSIADRSSSSTTHRCTSGRISSHAAIFCPRWWNPRGNDGVPSIASASGRPAAVHCSCSRLTCFGCRQVEHSQPRQCLNDQPERIHTPWGELRRSVLAFRVGHEHAVDVEEEDRGYEARMGGSGRRRKTESSLTAFPTKTAASHHAPCPSAGACPGTGAGARGGIFFQPRQLHARLGQHWQTIRGGACASGQPGG
jgi:hypothetical protein